LNYFRHQNAAIHQLSVRNWELDKKEEGSRKTEKNSYLWIRLLGVLLWGIGNWELGIGHWALLMFLRPIAISCHCLPITDYPLPNLSCRTAASVWLTKS
jgi:hypothetical protein